MRIVFDTNVLISYMICEKGVLSQAVDKAFDIGEALISDSVFRELKEVSGRPKFSKVVSSSSREEFLYAIQESFTSITVTHRVNDCEDAKDNQFLELALSGEADIIISSDKKHLLPMNPYKGIKILSPRQFLDLYG